MGVDVAGISSWMDDGGGEGGRDVGDAVVVGFDVGKFVGELVPAGHTLPF